MDFIFQLPLPFWLVIIALCGGIIWAWEESRRGVGIPIIAVLGTVAVWYVGDVIYNDYSRYEEEFGGQSLESAWWQVFLFVLSFLAMSLPVHGMMNRSLGRRRSVVMRYARTRAMEHRDVQRQISRAATGLFTVWGLLMVVALIQVKGDVLGLFAPYLGEKAYPWSRGQIGGGFSALISLASYLQIFLVAGVGVIAAVSRDPRTRRMALLICFLMMPTYIFDRTRNTMLATVLPGVLAWVFLRLRVSLPSQLGILAIFYFFVSFWFSVVMANREGMSFDVESAISGKGGKESGLHEGLNMFEELAWMNASMESGDFTSNGGRRYFAELVNPIPRGLWKNKPTIGLDYAVARGQAVMGPKGEVTATISTGMIGQGVVNFGRFFGPLAAAFLMSLWVAALARMDLMGKDPARLLLYACGIILTFNMGRDISLLVIYPFIFGLLLLKAWHHFKSAPKVAEVGQRGRSTQNRRRKRLP